MENQPLRAVLNERRIKPEIKARWVAALRSGEYKRSFLSPIEGEGVADPVGVLVDLFLKDTVTAKYRAKIIAGGGYISRRLTYRFYKWVGAANLNLTRKFFHAHSLGYLPVAARGNKNSGKQNYSIYDLYDQYIPGLSKRSSSLKSIANYIEKAL